MTPACIGGVLGISALRDLAPRVGVPGLHTFWGAFCRFAPNSLRHFCRRYGLCVLLAACGCNARAKRLWHCLLYFRVDYSHVGLFAKRIGWRSTAANLRRTRRSARVRCESVPGRVAVRPAGACQRGRRSKDVTMWRWIGSIKLVVSLLRSAFRLLSMGMCERRNSPWGTTPFFRRSADVTSMANPKCGLIRARQGLLFIQAIVPLSRMCAVSQIFRFLRNRFR
jgi:hypothetical protein